MNGFDCANKDCVHTKRVVIGLMFSTDWPVRSERLRYYKPSDLNHKRTIQSIQNRSTKIKRAVQHRIAARQTDMTCFEEIFRVFLVFAY